MTEREKRNAEWRARYEAGESLLSIAPTPSAIDRVRQGIVDAGGTIRPKGGRGAASVNYTRMVDGVRGVPETQAIRNVGSLRPARRAGKRRRGGL